MQDIYLKMASVIGNVLKQRSNQVIRVKGCPVSVAEQTLYLSLLGKVKNPYLDPSSVIPFVRSWFDWRFAKLFRWLLRIPYQRDLGPGERGSAAPGYIETA